MFSHCNLLNNLNLGDFNIKNVKDMSYMFSECRKLNRIVFNSIKKEVFCKEKYIFHYFLNSWNLG